MIPKGALSGGTIDSLIVYVSILGVLLLLGTAIRLKVPFFKKYHVPASLIAGIIGLILGPYFLGIIPKDIISSWGSLSGRLVAFIFAPMLMFNSVTKGKNAVKKAFGAFCYTYCCCFTQYAVPLLLSVFILIPLFHVNPLFSVILEEGWMGGHGTAGGMAMVFEDLGWADGVSLSITSATIGLIWGIVGGMVLINIAARKGWSRFLHDKASLKAAKEEMYPEGERPVDTYATVDNGVIDSLAYHFSILCVAVLIGWILRVACKTYLHLSISWFVTALFGGLIVKVIMNLTSWKNSLDRKTMSRIQGICLEFLVAGAVSSVNIPVVVKYAVPLLIQQAAMVVIMTFFAVWYCRRVFKDYWFENSMLHFGTFCGVFATGMLLLKTCDPDMKSDALEIYALRTPFSSWAVGGGVITGMMPYWLAQYGTIKITLITTVAAVVTFFLPRLIGAWFPPEKEVTAESN